MKMCEILKLYSGRCWKQPETAYSTTQRRSITRRDTKEHQIRVECLCDVRRSEYIERRLGELEDLSRGTLRVGLSPAVADVLLPHLLDVKFKGESVQKITFNSIELNPAIDGTEFDSSYSRGQPAEFPLDRVIKGWTEALPMMKPGAKWQICRSSLDRVRRKKGPCYGSNSPKASAI